MRRGAVSMLLVWLVPAATAGSDTPVALSELARDIRSHDGKQVTVAGTLGRIRMHISKKGERAYSFRVSDDGVGVRVLAPTPPACLPGAQVVAHGIVDGRSRRVDATSVMCP